MVQADPRKDPYEIIKHVNAFLSNHSFGIFLLVRGSLFVWALITSTIKLSLFFFGLANLFLWNQPLLGFFQLATLAWWRLYDRELGKTQALHTHAQAGEEALANVLDVMAKITSPANSPSSFFNKPAKKKERIVN